MESKDWSGFGYLSPDFPPGTTYRAIWSTTGEILDYKLILFRSGQFDHDMEKEIKVIAMF